MVDNDQKKKIAADCFKKGSQSLEAQNWDYAIEMFSTAVRMVPENLFYRQSLRGAERRKYNDNKKGKRLAGLSITKLKTKIKAARLKSDWTTVDKTAEEGLALNPWDAGLNASLGEAAAKRGFTEVAEFAYQLAIESGGEVKELLKSLADVYEGQDKFPEAIALWQRIQKLDPLDSEARTKSTQLQANSVMDRGGYEEAETTKDVEVNAYDVDRPVKQQIPEHVTGPGEDVEADLRRSIRKAPDEKQNYIKLASFLRDEKRFQDAKAELEPALEKWEDDPLLVELSEDVELECLMERIEETRQTVQASPNDKKLIKQYQQLQKGYVVREIEILKKRVTQSPKDLMLKFRLAKRLMKLKKWPEAIPLLQQASSDTRRQAEVLVHLGKCYHADGRKELALRQFEKAVPLIDQHENSAMFVEANYFCGRMFEEAGKNEQAEEHYLEVLGVDYEFKDVRERLDGLAAAETEED